MILERKEYMDWYQVEYEHKWWCKISASVTKPDGLNRFWININYDMEDGVQYSYNISSPLWWDQAKELAESIILHFKPELVPSIKNPKPEINKYEDWAIIKYEDKENRHAITVKIEWKRYSFIRVFNRYDLDCLILDYWKKIKLKKIDDKEEHFQLWMKERENFNLYIPQIERIINKFITLKDVKENIINSRSYWLNYMEIDKKIDNYASFILSESVNYFDNEDYSNEPNYNISDWEQKFANGLKKYLSSKSLDNQSQSSRLIKLDVDEQKPQQNKWLKWWQRLLIIFGILMFLWLIS